LLVEKLVRGFQLLEALPEQLKGLRPVRPELLLEQQLGLGPEQPLAPRQVQQPEPQPERLEELLPVLGPEQRLVQLFQGQARLLEP
jgi:hypothetical protein